MYIVGANCLKWCGLTFAVETRLAASPADCSTAADFPEALRLVIERQQAIARVVTLAAVRAGNEAAEVHSLAVVILGNGEGGAATAGDQEHARVLLVASVHLNGLYPELSG